MRTSTTFSILFGYIANVLKTIKLVYIAQLHKWKNKPNRKPLIARGATQAEKLLWSMNLQKPTNIDYILT